MPGEFGGKTEPLKMVASSSKSITEEIMDAIAAPIPKHSPSPWLVIDLKGSYGITNVKILNRGDCCSK